MTITPALALVLGGLITAFANLGIQALKNSGRLGAIRVLGDVKISSIERATIAKLLEDLVEERKAWQIEKDGLLSEREQWRVERQALEDRICDLQAAIDAYSQERARYAREETKLREKLQEFSVVLAARELRIKELEDRIAVLEGESREQKPQAS